MLSNILKNFVIPNLFYFLPLFIMFTKGRNTFSNRNDTPVFFFTIVISTILSRPHQKAAYWTLKCLLSRNITTVLHSPSNIN